MSGFKLSPRFWLCEKPFDTEKWGQCSERYLDQSITKDKSGNSYAEEVEEQHSKLNEVFVYLTYDDP